MHYCVRAVVVGRREVEQALRTCAVPRVVPAIADDRLAVPRAPVIVAQGDERTGVHLAVLDEHLPLAGEPETPTPDLAVARRHVIEALVRVDAVHGAAVEDDVLAVVVAHDAPARPTLVELLLPGIAAVEARERDIRRGGYREAVRAAPAHIVAARPCRAIVAIDIGAAADAEESAVRPAQLIVIADGAV